MAIPRFREERAGVDVGSRSGSGIKFEWHGWIVSVDQGCASSQRYGGGSGTRLRFLDGLIKDLQGGGYG